jgi:hypothetical protein
VACAARWRRRTMRTSNFQPPTSNPDRSGLRGVGIKIEVLRMSMPLGQGPNKSGKKSKIRISIKRKAEVHGERIGLLTSTSTGLEQKRQEEQD